ncbi:hypothetical protein LPJ74_001182 [Coemansia sp. RSA 1843]|nr:hypothetical protein LPJ74_001182 [Coemansia sp. RSA 1843]
MAMYTPSAYYSQPSVVVTPPQHAQPYPIGAGRRGSPSRSNNTASTPFLPMSIPLPSSLKENIPMAGPVGISSAAKLHAHQQSASYSSAHSHQQITPANYRHSKYSYAGSAYYPSAWDTAASTPPKDDLISSGLVSSGLSYHGSQHATPLYPLQQHSRRRHQYSGSGQSSYNGPLGFSTYHLGSHSQQQQPSYTVGSPQQQPQYLDIMRHNNNNNNNTTAGTSGSYSGAPLASSMPACVPIPILKNSVQKPRKRVTFADPLVTYLEASSAPSSVPYSSHLSIPQYSGSMPFAEQTGNAALRNSTYTNNSSGLSRTASLTDNNSPPRSELNRNQGHGGSSSSRSRHKTRHSIHGYSNMLVSEGSSGSYDPQEHKRHRHSQLYWDEGSTFQLEKLKLAHEHRDHSHSSSHSCHHRHRSSQRSKSSHGSSPPPANDSTSSGGRHHHYDERFALAMEHLPINNQSSS